MQTEWPHLLADLKAKRDGLNQVIAILETTFAVENGDGSAPIVPDPGAPRRKYTRRNVVTKKAKAAKRMTDRQTDRQSKGRATRERSAEPP